MVENGGGIRLPILNNYKNINGDRDMVKIGGGIMLHIRS